MPYSLAGMYRKGLDMKRILAFSGSNSSKSINQVFVAYAADKIGNHEVGILDIRDYPLPLYGMDLEMGEGIPDNAKKLKGIFSKQDALIIASPEHNGSIPAVFKNIIDWLSRIVEPGESFFGNHAKPVLLLSASPGPTGGATNLANMERLMPYWGGDVKGKYSLGGFPDCFLNGRLSVDKDRELTAVIEQFMRILDQ